MSETPWRQGAALPATKVRSDLPEHRPDPPACVQNAMLTKDKKPFTYTPGGIDLSEIRSPRMARRLERNALSEGVTPSQQVPPGHHRAGPLPPSALAAMQPQLQVQVFPSGGIPQPYLGAPPPPPPPPPPMKATTALPLDSSERPDMTKIIPENPMAMLRKTQGPVVKQDPILNKANYSDYKANEIVAPQQPVVNNTQVGSIYVPPVNRNTIPQSPQSPQYISQCDSPTTTIPAPPAFYKRQPSLPLSEPQSPPYSIQSKPPNFDIPRQASESPKPVPNKAPAPWLQRNQPQSQDIPEWVNDQRTMSTNNGQQVQEQIQKQPRPWSQKSVEKPDIGGWGAREQVKPEAQQWQPIQAEPQYWQQRQPEPQPWQQKQPEQQQWQQNQQQQEPKQWQQKQQETQPWRQQPAAGNRVQASPVNVHQSGGVKSQIQNRENLPEYFPNEKVEVVIVNDPPMVFQHTGQMPRGQRQQHPVQNQSVRIIPVQIEGATSNGHNNNDPRSLNRQLSWNSNPTQSNTFKVLQKITQTDGDDNESDQMLIEHSPKTPHNFPQQNVHRMKSNQGDEEPINKFKQGIDQDETVHNEIDPRYRGSHIPSKAFKLLQNITSWADDLPISSTVPPEEPVHNRGPKVRTIPIQIEGDGPARTYVPPSERTVAEPKKYMGGAIPSRSFKILQAITAPDECGPGQSDL